MNRVNNDSKLAILIEKLRLPSALSLEPWLKRLIAEPDSVVIIAIEKPLGIDGPHVGTAWLSGTERTKVRKALVRINDARKKRTEQTTNEMPH